MLVVDGRLVVLSEDGEVVLVQPDPAAYREIARYRALSGKCWNAPAFSDGRLYVRSTLEAVCLDVAGARPTSLKLESLPLAGGGAFRLRVSDADGGVLPPDALDGVEVLASPDPAQPLVQWATLSLTPVAVPGGFELEDRQSTNLARRFYLLRQGD
jgi:hypothetical protein